MAFQAVVYKVLIASPGDVVAERKALPEVVYFWNATHSEDFGVILMPVMWETHSTPEMGDRPQAILNKQIVASCDLLVGAFWTRIGTHTGAAESGTVEEIEEMKKAGKPVMLYFSSVPVVPDSVDHEQYKKLIDFKIKCQDQGLIDKYDSISELREKLFRHLTSKVRSLHGESTIRTNKTDEDLGVLELLKDQLRAVIARAEVDWSTERDSQPVSGQNAKHILEELASDLVELSATAKGSIGAEVSHKIDAQISKLKKLMKHQFYLDGGKSYKKFWDSGNEIFTNLGSIIREVGIKSHLEKEPVSEAKMDEAKVKF